MRRLIQTTALCVALATSAQADITYQGRDAQGLHCAAMFGVVVLVLEKAGRMTNAEAQESFLVAKIILDQLPGTEAEKHRALSQRGAKILRTRSGEQLVHEFLSTSKWCQREFLTQ
ncbi:MAG: hypothetical protein CFE33_07810 [Pseudorhodobacter sp. PARRP1]|nr:MAG: hypothetical protein CFE33_07810 [Pseudorhodobacter sp. PARRP1]